MAVIELSHINFDGLHAPDCFSQLILLYRPRPHLEYLIVVTYTTTVCFLSLAMKKGNLL